MKYNPVTNTIDRPDGTPYLHLAPCIGAQEAYQIADTLLQAPEWEKEKEELEAQIGKLEYELKHRENVADELSKAQAEIERLEDSLEASRMMAEEFEMELEGSKVELTQARLRIEELEAMLASAEAALKAEADEQEDMRMERDLLS